MEPQRRLLPRHHRPGRGAGHRPRGVGPGHPERHRGLARGDLRPGSRRRRHRGAGAGVGRGRHQRQRPGAGSAADRARGRPRRGSQVCSRPVRPGSGRRHGGPTDRWFRRPPGGTHRRPAGLARRRRGQEHRGRRGGPAVARRARRRVVVHRRFHGGAHRAAAPHVVRDRRFTRCRPGRRSDRRRGPAVHDRPGRGERAGPDGAGQLRDAQLPHR